MGGEPGGDLTHAGQNELDALRRRAYGPDADIFDDPLAVDRLRDLEERVRLDRLPAEIDTLVDEDQLAAATESPIPTMRTSPTLPSRLRTPRWHPALGATAVLAVLLGAAVSGLFADEPPETLPSGFAKTAAAANERRAAGYESGYESYLNGLRDDVLTLPGGEGVAGRMIRDQLRPYGALYGRIVAAGPTVDKKFCMIIDNEPAPATTCISIENAYSHPVSIVLPSAFARPDADALSGTGELVSYTLMPDGSVTARAADSPPSPVEPDSTRSATEPAPEKTAVPPPGWQ